MAVEAQRIFLSSLLHLTLPQVKVVLAQATRSQILALRELTINVLNRNLDIGTYFTEKLRPYATFLRSLAKGNISKTGLSRKNRAIVLLIKASEKVLLE